MNENGMTGMIEMTKNQYNLGGLWGNMGWKRNDGMTIEWQNDIRNDGMTLEWWYYYGMS